VCTKKKFSKFFFFFFAFKFFGCIIEKKMTLSVSVVTGAILENLKLIWLFLTFWYKKNSKKKIKKIKMSTIKQTIRKKTKWRNNNNKKRIFFCFWIFFNILFYDILHSTVRRDLAWMKLILNYSINKELSFF